MANRPDEEELRATEEERLRALRERDLGAAELLHADDFELITPEGILLSREAYLGGIASGTRRYLTWTPEEIRVGVHGESAVLRYRSTIEVIEDGHHYSPGRYWHTATYERRDRRWQVVWSHATEIE